MKFLADENVPLPSALLLRRLGWDVRHIAEDCPAVIKNDGHIRQRPLPA